MWFMGKWHGQASVGWGEPTWEVAVILEDNFKEKGIVSSGQVLMSLKRAQKRFRLISTGWGETRTWKTYWKGSEVMEEISPGKSFKNSWSEHFFIKHRLHLWGRDHLRQTSWLGAMVEECHGGKPEVRGGKSGLETQREALREVRWQEGSWEKQRLKTTLPFAGRIISEVCYTFMSNDLEGCTWIQEKRQAPGAWIYSGCSFCFNVLANKAVQEKHPQRGRELMLKMQHHMTHVGMAGYVFCFNSALA